MLSLSKKLQNISHASWKKAEISRSHFYIKEAFRKFCREGLAVQIRQRPKGVAAEHLLTDNGREYCGRPLQHPFELFLANEQDRAPKDRHWIAADQRLLRAFSSDGQRGVLLRRVP
jgi:hypothetical protein